MLIRLQRIYNLWSIHAILVSILDVLWALLCTFILFLGLTHWPRAQCQFMFFPLFQCFKEKEYQTESKRNETFWRSYFWKESNPGDLECTSGKQRGRHEAGERAYPPSIYPKTIGEQNRSGVPPPQASVATKNQSGPCSGTLPEEGTLTGGHLHHPGDLHDEEGVVHPRGWGYVPVAMCLISLSRVLEVIRSWCIASFAIIVGSYDASPPLLSCNGLSFPFEVIL